MEKENIQKMIEEGQRLAEKQSWITKGYVELLAKLNCEFAKIPDLDLKDSHFLIREWKQDKNQYKNQYPSFGRKVYAKMVWTNDAVFSLQLRKEDEYEWKREDLNDPSITTIREFAKKLPEILEFFLGEISKQNQEHQEAIDIMQNLIAKLGV